MINETNQTLICTTDGNYAVEVVKGVCTDTSAIEQVSIITSFSNIPKNGIKVYPNPTNGLIYVDIRENPHESKIVITDSNGSIVKEVRSVNQRLLTITIDGPSGIYFITIISNGQNSVFRIIKN